MQYLNKKGLADIIAISFMIILTCVVVFILFSYVRGSLELAPEFTSCAELIINPPVIFGERVCFNEETGDIEIEIKRPISTANLELFSLDFLVSNGQKSFNQQCSSACGGNCHILSSGTQTYYIESKFSDPSALSISANGCASFGYIEIVPC